MIHKEMGSNHDPDTYLETSSGYCEIVAEKSPTGGYRGWFFIVIKFRTGCVLQFITPDNGVQETYYIRKGFLAGGTITWTHWDLISAQSITPQST